MNAVFTALILAGLAVGLLCVACAIYLLFKRVTTNVTEIEFKHLGKIKTAETGLALVFLGIILFLSSASIYNRAKRGDDLRSSLDSLMISTARDLRREFHLVIDGRKPPLSPESFARVEFLIGLLQQVDPSNGHAYYYAGEVYRWTDRLEAAQSKFYKYIETLDSVPEKEKSGSIDAEICYQRPHGYCRQRTAWIHHELANDFYKDAEANADPIQRLYRCRKALEQAQLAIQDFPPNGFEQPIATAVLVSKLTREIPILEEQIKENP